MDNTDPDPGDTTSPPTTMIGFNAPQATREALERLAKIQDRSLSAVIRVAVREYLERQGGTGAVRQQGELRR